MEDVHLVVCVWPVASVRCSQLSVHAHTSTSILTMELLVIRCHLAIWWPLIVAICELRADIRERLLRLVSLLTVSFRAADSEAVLAGP